MPLHFNSFATTLLVSGLITFFLGYIIYQRLGGAAKWFGILLLFLGIWSVAYAFELSCTTLDQMLFWINIEYIGIATLPALWFVFCIQHTGHSAWLTPINRFFIFLFPVATLLMVWTNAYHHFHYSEVGIDTSGPFPLLAFKQGFWYTVHTVFFYFLLAAGNYLLVVHYKQSDIIYRRQNISLMMASFFPWLVNLVYLTGVRPFGHIDLTPFAFMITSVTIGIGLLRFNLFNIVPLAYEKVIAGMNDGMLILDAYNRILDANKGFVNLIPNADKTLLGKYLEDVLPDKNDLYHRIQSLYTGKFEYRYNNLIFEVGMSHITDKHMRHKGSLLVFRDITQTQEAAELLLKQSIELAKLNKTKDAIFSVISHDLRSPLASLAGMINLTKDGSISEAEFKTFLPALSADISYTTRLIDNLLHWSKSQLKGEKPNAAYFNISQVVQHELSYFIKPAQAKQVSIESELPEVFTVFADKEMIQLVLRNLISNAVKFCGPGQHIKIKSIPTDQNHANICVEDTGIGIEADVLQELMENNTISKRGTANEPGTGLGLMICKDFVEKNNGVLSASSIPGKGSQFCFSIPTGMQGA